MVFKYISYKQRNQQMNFLKFLNENYITSINKEKAIELIKEKCKSFDFNNPIFRGSAMHSYQYELIDTTYSHRESANTTNHYTVILDKLLSEQKLPQRSKSIICSNNKKYAKEYGNLYVIIPFDDANIGICPTNDIWDITIDGVDYADTINEINILYHKHHITDFTYDHFIEDLIEYVKDMAEDNETSDLIDFIGNNPNNVESNIRAMYDLKDNGFKFCTGKTYNNVIDDMDHEVWISGKSILLDVDSFEEIKSEIAEG